MPCKSAAGGMWMAAIVTAGGCTSFSGDVMPTLQECAYTSPICYMPDN